MAVAPPAPSSRSRGFVIIWAQPTEMNTAKNIDDGATPSAANETDTLPVVQFECRVPVVFLCTSGPRPSQASHAILIR